MSFFLRCVRDPIWVSRIENRVPRIRENYHRVPTGPYRVPNIFLKKKTGLDTSLYFIIANFHTKLNPQVNVSHDMNSPVFALYTTFDFNNGQFVKHVALIRFN